MKTNKLVLIAPVVLFMSSAGFLLTAHGQEDKSQPEQKTDKVEQPDPFLGEFNSDSHYYGAKLITITKEGNYYRMSDHKGYKFIKKSDHELQDEKGILGSISLGHLVFEGDKAKEQQIVLRVSFCYNWGLLVKR